MRSLGGETALLACHGDLIPALVEKLVPGALEMEGGAGCPKGSTWLLQEGAGGRARASYLPPPRAGAARPDVDARRRIAVVDLGSTSFTLLVADVTADGHIVRVAREREMLRLGAALAQESKLSDELCERAVEAARRLRRLADRAGAQELVAVATSAMRDAKNGRKLAERISRALGSEVRILSGEEEARLIFSAFRRRVGLGDENALGLDLGGGQPRARGRERFGPALRDDAAARRHAPARRARALRSDDRPRRRARCARASRRRSIRSRAASARSARCAASRAGRNRARARAAPARRPRRRAERGSARAAGPRGGLRRARAPPRAVDHAERLALPGIDEKRADLLPTGAVVMATVLERLSLPGLMICDWGLREGVILDALAARAFEQPHAGVFQAG